MIKVIYLSGKIANGGIESHDNILKNAEEARRLSVKLWNLGFAVITPHLNTAGFEKDSRVTVSWDQFIDADLSIMNVCHGIVFMNNWKESKGAKIEHEHAIKNNMVIFYEDDIGSEDMLNFRDSDTYMNIPLIKVYKAMHNKSFISIPRME